MCDFMKDNVPDLRCEAHVEFREQVLGDRYCFRGGMAHAGAPFSIVIFKVPVVKAVLAHQLIDALRYFTLWLHFRLANGVFVELFLYALCNQSNEK